MLRHIDACIITFLSYCFGGGKEEDAINGEGGFLQILPPRCQKGKVTRGLLT